MPLQNALTRRLGLAHPIVQAPMAGGGDTPDLVAAVSQAGGIGCIGAAYLTPRQIAETAAAVRARTERPFGINLFAPLTPANDMPDAQSALQRVSPYYAELGLPPPERPPPPEDRFDAQLAVCLDAGATLFSFTLGMLPEAAVAAIKDRGILLAGTATTVAEAVALERAGADAVIAQGAEAGGHRGTFLGDFESAQVGTMALVPQVADAVAVPVIASGGIMDGRGIAAALTLGAAAVQMGTAFLACDEAGVAEAYKQALAAARETETRLTRAFSGRPARGIANRFVREIDAAGDDAILPFPLQNALTRPIRAAASALGKADFLSLWAGQGVGLVRRGKAADLVARLAAEADAAVAGFSSRP